MQTGSSASDILARLRASTHAVGLESVPLFRVVQLIRQADPEDFASARGMLQAVLEDQRADGFIPWRAARPGCDPIGTPLLTWATLGLFRNGGLSDEEVHGVYPRLSRYVTWLRENRLFADELGLFAWHGRPEWDSDSCRFAGPGDFCSPDLASFLALEMEALSLMAEVLGLPADTMRWRERRLEVQEGLNYHLWDDLDGCYYDACWSGELRRIPGPHTVLPLLARIATPPRAQRLRLRGEATAGKSDLLRVLLDGQGGEW